MYLTHVTPVPSRVKVAPGLLVIHSLSQPSVSSSPLYHRRRSVATAFVAFMGLFCGWCHLIVFLFVGRREYMLTISPVVVARVGTGIAYLYLIVMVRVRI